MSPPLDFGGPAYERALVESRVWQPSTTTATPKQRRAAVRIRRLLEEVARLTARVKALEAGR